MLTGRMGVILFRIARLRIMGTLVGLIFTYFPFLIPVRKIMIIIT